MPSASSRTRGRLESYREQIREVDRELVALYAARCALVRTLWELKAAVGLPLVDPAQEEVELARARARAASTGLDPEGGERLLRWILEEGHRALPPSAAIVPSV